MNLIDMRTVILGYIISNGVSAIVIGFLWVQARRRFTGLGFWLIDFVMQFAALLLVALRGTLPDLVSATGSNTMIVGGTIVLYTGLGRFMGKPVKQTHNMILLFLFVCFHVYFLLVFPSLHIRNILFSLALLLICGQCAWLLLKQLEPDLAAVSHRLGLVFFFYCLISVIRIFLDMFLPSNNDFFNSNTFDTLLVMIYQMLSIVLALSLVLTVNRRLLMNMEQDIVKLKQAEEASVFLATIVKSTDDAIFGKTLDGIILSWNRGAEKMYGYTSDEVIGKPVFILSPPDRMVEIENILEKLKHGNSIQHLETVRRRKNGELINVSLTISPIWDGEGNLTGASTIARDITRSKQAEKKLLQLSRAVEQSPESILITNTKGLIEYVNPRFSQLTGYSAEEVLGKNPNILKSGKTSAETYHQLWDALAHGREFRGEFVNKKKNGELYYEAGLFSPIMDSQGVITHYLAILEDVTEQKQTEAEIQRLQTELHEQAVRDPLTGLYNRRFLNEALNSELARAMRENFPVSFIMIDIDRFKHLNDTFGHPAGDVVLKQLAAQILSQSRAFDIICRFGGEEFLAILPNITSEIAFQVAERWRRSFWENALSHENGKIRTTISCGISEFPLDGESVDELISVADQALYQAKEAGRNRVVIWNGAQSKSR